MSASKYPESHKLDKISMQHKNHQTRESQPFTLCVSSVIMSSSNVTNLSPATSSFPCQCHSTIVHSHLRLKKALIKKIKRKKPRTLQTLQFSVLYRGSVWQKRLRPFLIASKFNNQKIQGEHKVFPWLQTFIARKLRGIQT